VRKLAILSILALALVALACDVSVENNPASNADATNNNITGTSSVCAAVIAVLEVDGPARQVTAEASNAPGCLSYLWDFGDGSRATGRSVEHGYLFECGEGVSAVGFTVSLTAEGLSNSATDSADVVFSCEAVE
jgi:PKD repeat protein